MALNANSLKDLIKTNLANIDPITAQSAMQELATTLSTYIKVNAQVTFVWAATLPNPPYTPDPIVVTVGNVITLEFALTPSGLTDSTAAQDYLKNQLIAGLTEGTINVVTSGFITTPITFATSPSLNSLDLIISGSNPDDAQLDFATKIVDWVKLQKPSAPCTGSHLPYIGTGIVSSII